MLVQLKKHENGEVAAGAQRVIDMWRDLLQLVSQSPATLKRSTTESPMASLPTQKKGKSK